LELIFGLILVLMMIFRREGLWPAVRRVSALTREQQAAAPARGAAVRLSWARPEPAGGPARPLLLIEGLTKRFGGVSAAADITLGVRAGELVSVIGPNGSGKTTLFNLITGHTPAAAPGPPGVRALLRQPSPHRDRPGDHDAAEAPAPRRAGGGDEPRGDARADGPDQGPPRPRHHHHPHRAQARRRDGRVGP